MASQLACKCLNDWPLTKTKLQKHKFICYCIYDKNAFWILIWNLFQWVKSSITFKCIFSVMSNSEYIHHITWTCHLTGGQFWGHYPSLTGTQPFGPWGYLLKLRTVMHNTVNLESFDSMMTSSNGNIFHVTFPLWGESTGHQWIPLTKASDVELWCFLWSAPEQMVEQTNEMLVILASSCSLWHHCNVYRHAVVPCTVSQQLDVHILVYPLMSKCTYIGLLVFLHFCTALKQYHWIRPSKNQWSLRKLHCWKIYSVSVSVPTTPICCLR